MAEVRRVQSEPAWLLHHRPFRDTSRILELMTRDHGRLSLVARGSRAAKSRLAGILRPFMPLSISWFSRTELGTLTDGFSSITIGDVANGTGTVQIDTATFTDPITIVGGAIAVTELNAGSNPVTLTARTGAITDGVAAALSIG